MKKIRAIEGLRGILALWVLVGDLAFFTVPFAATLLGILICGEALNRFVEQPGIALGRRRAGLRLATQPSKPAWSEAECGDFG